MTADVFKKIYGSYKDGGSALGIWFLCILVNVYYV
jgi:hypothetical protein